MLACVQNICKTFFCKCFIFTSNHGLLWSSSVHDVELRNVACCQLLQGSLLLRSKVKTRSTKWSTSITTTSTTKRSVPIEDCPPVMLTRPQYTCPKPGSGQSAICSNPCLSVSAKLHYTKTGYGHVVQHHQRTSSQQFYNLLYNKFTTNGQKISTFQHLDMSRCWALALRCGKFIFNFIRQKYDSTHEKNKKRKKT